MRVALLLLLAVTLAPAQSSPAATSPEITIVGVTFENVTQLSTADQDAVASDLKTRTYHGDKWLDEVGERARYVWQSKGYYGATVHADAHPRNSDLHHPEMIVTLSIDEGPKYLLSAIEWTGTPTFPTQELDRAISLKRFDTLDVEKIRAGLEKLRRMFEEKGYLQALVIPNSKIDDGQHVVTLQMDIEPGPVFHVGHVAFLGGAPDLRKAIQQKWPLHPGAPYNPHVVTKLFSGENSDVPYYMSPADNVHVDVDEQTHLVNLTVNLDRH
jgi:outer membrane protein assembly factor BamA